MALAACKHALGKEPETVAHLRRAVDLALRYDYEYWLQREVVDRPEMFGSEEAVELLPAELREQLAAARQRQTKRPAPARIAVEANP